MALAQGQAGNIGVISAIAAGNIESHSVKNTYSPPHQPHDVEYSYPVAPAQIPIPSYSSGPLKQDVKEVKIVEDHGHANSITPQLISHQHVKHIKVHQGLQSYPDHGYFSARASPQYVKVLKITHQEGQVVPSPGQQPQHIQVIRVHHDDHDHSHSASVATRNVQQKQASVQPIKVIKVIHDYGPIDHSAHNQIAQPIVQNQTPQPVKVIKVYHDNGPVNHEHAANAAFARIKSGWAPAAPPSVRFVI